MLPEPKKICHKKVLCAKKLLLIDSSIDDNEDRLSRFMVNNRIISTELIKKKQ